MVNKILFIAGPTATGKTDLGLVLAKEFGGEIISCDSRQVYRGMDIVTGKDFPVKIKDQKSKIKYKDEYINFYLFDDISLWLLDIVEPSEQFHVSAYYDLAWEVIEDCWKRGKLPIVVGVTGFYMKALIEGIETISIPQNEKLREKLETISVQDLKKLLAHLDPQRLQGMNESDSENPRRLVRAIEVAEYRSKIKNQKSKIIKTADTLWIGLTAPFEVLYQRIDERVEKRIKEGAIEETKELIAMYGKRNLVLQGTGYKDIVAYLEGEISLEEAIQKWKFQEHNDARKQLTFFKGIPKIQWYSIEDTEYIQAIRQKVAGWYIMKSVQ